MTVYNRVTAQTPRRRFHLLLLLLFPLGVGGGIQSQGAQAGASRQGLSEVSRLAAIYDNVLGSRFDRAREDLRSACPPAPSEACQTLQVALVWWQVVLDPHSRVFDDELEAAAALAIAATDAWTRREPRRAEAWFYHAASYGPLVQLRVLRGQRLAAARDGNRIRIALERALSLDPSLHDARFGIGLYHYYADVAPAAAKMLRWLFLLPGGDRRQGLREMLEARDRGRLLVGEADFQLHWLYLWYEHQPQRAIELLQGLHARYPTNPVFLQRIAEVQDEYVHDHPASAASWQALLDRVTAGSMGAAALAETRAQLGLAVQLDALHETDRAIVYLQRVVQSKPAAPFGALPHAQLLLGRYADRLGQRDRATTAYRAVLSDATASADDRADAQARLRQTVDATQAEAYRSSLEGWRALERGDVPHGLATLTRARSLAPRDATIAYRLARALVASGELVRARAALEEVVDRGERVPAVVMAAASVELGALLERSREPSLAIARYERAMSIVGSDPRTHQAASEALKRLVR